MKEREIKLRIRELSSSVRRLSELGGVIKKPRHFEDNLVFDTPEGSLRKERKLLRVRIANGDAIFTFKDQPDVSTGIKVREEIEVNVSKAEEFMEILRRLGFRKSFRYQKYRTDYAIPGVDLLFCVDETPIGNYLELEGNDEQIRIYAERLGYTQKDFITASYAGLYQSWCREEGITADEMIFR